MRVETIAKKTCTKCGVEKLCPHFSKDKQKRDGLCSACKACDAAASAARSRAHPEKAKARSAAHYEANKGKVKEASIDWRVKNPQRFLEASLIWRSENKSKLAAANAKWAKANPEVVRIKSHNRRAKKRMNGGTLSKGLTAKLFALQGGMCPCCRQPLGVDFQMDHIQPLALGGTNTDDNMQLLRQRCNGQKHARHPVDFMQSRGFLL